MRYRCVDVESFGGDFHLFVLRHRTHRLHIMEAVCDLYKYHAHVVVHCQEQFAEVLGLQRYIILLGKM